MAEGTGNNSNKRRISQVSATSSNGIPTKNRFDPLLNKTADNEDQYSDTKMVHNQQQAGAPSQNGGNRSIKKPPPVIVDGTITDGNTAIQALKGLLKDKFQYKYANGKTNFYTNNDEDHNKLKEYLTEKKFQFHTYTLSSDKLVKLILKGLPPSISTDDIKEELTDLKFMVEKIRQINQNQEYPLYSVLFRPGTLIQEIFKIKTLCYCIVSWEKPHKKIYPTQCFKCQKYHHIANNCTRDLKCRKCAGNHHIKDCIKEDEDSECANCNQKHPANSKTCEIYIKVSEKRRNMQSSRYLQPSGRSAGANQTFPTQNHHWPQLSPSTSSMMNTQPPTSTPSSGALPPPCSPVIGTQESGGFGNILQELKSLFGGLNFAKILLSAKSLIAKIKRAPDGFSKFTIILDAVCELFDD